MQCYRSLARRTTDQTPSYNRVSGDTQILSGLHCKSIVPEDLRDRVQREVAGPVSFRDRADLRLQRGDFRCGSGGGT